MFPNRSRRFTPLPMFLALIVTASACGEEDASGPQGGSDPWVGSWTATSFVALGSDFIADGMMLQATFTASTYSLTVSNDQVDLCGDSGSTSCTTTGPIAGTSSQITFDSGDDEVTFNYSVSGNTMTWTGSIDGNPVTITWARTS